MRTTRRSFGSMFSTTSIVTGVPKIQGVTIVVFRERKGGERKAFELKGRGWVLFVLGRGGGG